MALCHGAELLTTLDPWTMTFDAESRMEGFTSPSNGSGQYTYDGTGRRVTKSVGSTTTIYIYDAQRNRAAEYASTVPTPPCTTCYETVDTLGSVRAVTDGLGNMIALHDYLPFGEELSRANRIGVPGYGISDGLVDRFTGKPRDAETGLDWWSSRYMSSQQGRFTSPDATGSGSGSPSDPQSWNEYSYARNNPHLYTDPDGFNYQVCDANGNCSNETISDQEFASEQADGKANGEYFNQADGTMYHLDSNGDRVSDGTFRQVDVDVNSYGGALIQRLGQMAGAQQKFIGLFAAGSAAVGASGGSIAYLYGSGGALTSLSIPVATLAPRVTNSRLQEMLANLFREVDTLPGGTAGAVRYEIRTGELLSSSGHSAKAGEYIQGLTRMLKSGELSLNDQLVTRQVIGDLAQALSTKH